jgi:hypothetical protein
MHLMKPHAVNGHRVLPMIVANGAVALRRPKARRAATSAPHQMATASSSNATASRRAAGSSVANS